MKKWLLFLCLTAGMQNLATADATATGDPEAGKEKSVTCAACHGNDGNSMIPMNPKIAGQHAKYLEKQLMDFRTASKTGGQEGRNNAVMNGMAAALTDQDIKDLAAFYSDQKANEGTTPEDVIDAGGKLYRGGDVERGVTACIACHGPRGNGTSLSNFPDISGQHPEYIKAQLEQFRSGTRANDLNGMMRDIAMKLTDEDIDLLAKYLGGLH